jgi:CubicO group peptidase (beta-lactamase class C family)
MTALEFGKRYLFNPLGITNVLWPADPQGVTRGWGDLALEPQDIVKLGALFLNRGVLLGRRIVSKAWVEAATAAPEGSEFPGWPDGEGRGYLWWLAPDGYRAAGRGEQWVLVYPDDDLVVGLTGGGGFDDPTSVRLRFLDDFVREPSCPTGRCPPTRLATRRLPGRSLRQRAVTSNRRASRLCQPWPGSSPIARTCCHPTRTV